jgi:AAA15 family ATPase/GTPase
VLEIREIHIKNFRSIVNLTLSTKGINIFVGLNDVGKSNVLKALNLFFNNQTDENSEFNFYVDYSKLAPKRSNKAEEIVVQIKFEIPSNYKDAGEFTWKKIWRSTGLHFDTLKEHTFSAYSKTPVLLKRINYTYVPATKSNEYFMRLLGDLYSIISYDAESEINKKTTEYTDSIQSFTRRVSEIIKSNLGIDSALAMPPSQIDIFRLLTFNTKDIKNNSIYLGQRGDGIKSRHIPAILKFISEYNNNTYNIKGSVPATTIWGYEEPETGIELSKCFDLANELLEYSKEIQIFATTHSPAFYTLKDSQGVGTFYISKDNNSCETINLKDLSATDIHKEIGLMPLITPYIKNMEDEILALKEILDNNFLTDIHTLCVEGKTDKETLEYIINIKSQKLRKLIQDNKLRILTKDEGCGTTQLTRWVKAWNLTGFTSKIYALFDKDNAGIDAKQEIDRLASDQRPANMKSQFLQPTAEIKQIFQKMSNKNAFLYEIEHLYSIEFWKLLKDNTMLQLRDDAEVKRMFSLETRRDETVDAYIDRVFDNPDIRDTIIAYNPNDHKKASIFSRAKKEYEENNATNIFDGFQSTLDDLERFFC